MPDASKTLIFVMRRTSIAILRRLSSAASHASAIHCGTNGLQQFVIEQKHYSRGQGLGSISAVNECGEPGWRVPPTSGFFRNA